jgi:hypothetical protein
MLSDCVDAEPQPHHYSQRERAAGFVFRAHFV